MRRLLRRGALATVVLLLCLSLSSCVGPFNLTSTVLWWNNSIQGDDNMPWVEELVFLVFIILPVYDICEIGDALIFNTIEFWGGTNPIPSPDWKAANERGAGRFRLARHEKGGVEVLNAAGELLLTSEVTPGGGLVIRDGRGAEVRRFSAAEAGRIREALARR